MLLALGAPVFFQSLQCSQSQGLVKRHLVRIHFHSQDDFRPRRQLLQDLRLDAPENEGLNQLLQTFSGVLVLVFFDGNGKAGVEPLLRAQKPRVDEVEERIEFSQVIFYGSPRRDELEGPLEPHGRLGALGGNVLDGLSLIQNDGAPFDGGKELRLLVEQTVADHQDIHFLEIVDRLRAIPTAEGDEIERGSKAIGFGHPIHTNGRGSHHQGGTLRSAIQNDGQRLQGLSEPHVVGQAGPHSQVSESREPVEAVHLVVAKIRFQGGGKNGCKSLSVLDALKAQLPCLVGVQVRKVLRKIFDGQSRQGMEAKGFPPLFCIAVQLFEPFAEFVRQGHELPFPERNEALAGILKELQ